MTRYKDILGTIAVAACLAGSSAIAQEVYEGGRGLITLEGPTGLFINPTSGTMPAGYGTVQYCVFFPNQNDDLFDTPAVGHGGIASYGVTDELEVGVQGTLIDRDAGSNFNAVGPFARYRVLKDVEDGAPETSIGAYSRFGDEEIQKIGVFLAASKRAQFEGAIRSAAVHAGVRGVFTEEPAVENVPKDENGQIPAGVVPEEVDEHFAIYAGLELEFPLRIYAVGEIQPYTTDDDIVNPTEEIPYAFGLQWRAGGINMSVAGIQPGGTEDVSFYYGIGSAISF